MSNTQASSEWTKTSHSAYERGCRCAECLERRIGELESDLTRLRSSTKDNACKFVEYVGFLGWEWKALEKIWEGFAGPNEANEVYEYKTTPELYDEWEKNNKL